LTTEFQKAGATVQRKLVGDRHYTGVDGAKLALPGRSLLLVVCLLRRARPRLIVLPRNFC
jgi:hypothetical protein